MLFWLQGMRKKSEPGIPGAQGGRKINKKAEHTSCAMKEGKKEGENSFFFGGRGGNVLNLIKGLGVGYFI